MTAQAGGQADVPTSTATATPAPGQPTATSTPTGVSQAQVATATPTPVPANSAVILGGRGRVANVAARSFSVLWMTDAATTGQINYGTTAALGTTAFDRRGAQFSGQTHFVDVAGLQPNTTYFFDVVSGGTIDNNAGQHFQMRTGPEIGTPPQANRLVGQVLNPGGASPAGGALLWANLKDANGQGTSGSSQLLATLAEPDGRFNLTLDPRVPDLSAYFIYSNSGDQIEVAARAPTGEASGAVDTAVTQNGGTTPSEVRLILAAVTPTPTFTPVPAAPTATATPAPAAATPTPTPAPAFPTATFTPAPAAPAQPTATIPPTPTQAPALQLPIQLPPLKEMLLAQIGLASPTPRPTDATPPGAVAPAAGPAPAYPPAPVGVPQPGPAVATAPPTQARTAQAPTQAPVVPPPAGPITTAPNLAPSPAGAPPTGQLPPAQGTPFSALPAAPAPPVSNPDGPAPTPTTAPGPSVLSDLAAMPPLVMLLFYGGLALVLIGGAVAIYSLLAGPEWRPR